MFDSLEAQKVFAYTTEEKNKLHNAFMYMCKQANTA